MNVAQGVVEVVFKNNAGFYNIKLQDGDWYGYGKNKPDFDKGNQIEFEYVENGKFKNIEAKTVTVAKPTVTVAPSTSGSGGTDWDSKDKRIQWMSSRNTALEIIKLGFEQGALKLPTKANEKFDALMGIVDEVTENLFWDTMDAPSREKPPAGLRAASPTQGDFD